MCVYTHICVFMWCILYTALKREKKIYYRELAHIITELEKSYYLFATRWRWDSFSPHPNF